jgi:hypothetical protein
VDLIAKMSASVPIDPEEEVARQRERDSRIEREKMRKEERNAREQDRMAREKEHEERYSGDGCSCICCLLFRF